MTDSVLRADSANAKAHASQLAALAAFAGRTGLATQYLRLSGPSALRQGVEVVPATDDAFAALLVRAALGVCDDSLRTLPASIVQTLSSYVGAADRQHAADALLERPLSLAVPCTGPKATLMVSHPASTLLRIQQIAARDDRAGVRRLLDSLAQTRAGMRPGGVSLDYTIQEAWLAEFAGDPRGAADRLDVSLTALPTLSSFIVTEAVMAASVGRAMAYRAELAARHERPRVGRPVGESRAHGVGTRRSEPRKRRWRACADWRRASRCRSSACARRLRRTRSPPPPPLS